MSEIIIVNETPQWSIITDIFTFAPIFGLLWFNHQYLAGSTWLDIVFVIILLLAVSGHASTRKLQFKTATEAVEYLKSDKFRANTKSSVSKPKRDTKGNV